MSRPVDDLIQLSALLDNELREAEVEEVKKKLINSEKLRREFEYLKALDRLLRNWDRDDIRGIRASVSFEKNLGDRLKKTVPATGAAEAGLSATAIYHI